RFDAIREALSLHKAGALVVYNLDRLARDVSGLLDELKSYESRGIELHESMGGVVGTNADARLMVGVRGAMDEHHARITGEKTKHALRSLRMKGRRYSHIPPFGYSYQGVVMVPHPGEQASLAKIKAMA